MSHGLDLECNDDVCAWCISTERCAIFICPGFRLQLESHWFYAGSRKSPGEDTGCAHADDVCLGQKVKHARPARPDLLDPRRCARLRGRES